MPFTRSKSVEFLFHQLPFMFLWYNGKVLLARLVHLCSGFTKLTIFRDGLAQTAKFTKLTIFAKRKVALRILQLILFHTLFINYDKFYRKQLFSKCYGDKNTSFKRRCRYAFFYNRSAPCKFWLQKEKH